MILDPLDIACYVYCPILCKGGNRSRISAPLTFAERHIRQAFITGEQNAALKDNIVTPRKLLASWDKIWWPAASERGIKMDEAEKVSLNASQKFTDYCKYDISDYMFPTAGAGIISQVHIGENILQAQADVVKVDLHKSYPTTVLIDFGRKGLSGSVAPRDPAVRATAYAFYSGRDETIIYISIDIDEKLDKLNVTESVFRPKDMEHIRRMLYHVERGIRGNIYYENPYLCDRCKECPSFT